MRKILRVMRYEIINTLTSRSFLFTALGLPIISALIFTGVGFVNRKTPSVLPSIVGASAPAQGTIAEGLVDQSGLIRTIPGDLDPAALQRFPDEAAARSALQDGKIKDFYLIPADYLQTGEILYVRPDFNPLSAFDQSSQIQWVVQTNLLGGDAHLARQVQYPLNLQATVRAPASNRNQDDPLTFILPYAVTMIYYIVILMASSLLLNSVTKEKENRVMEILMVTINPRQLLTGKIIGLGLVGLLQTALWVGTGYTMLRLGGSQFSIPATFQLPPSFLAWGALFFILGYALYASLMGAVGALVPNLREASQATFVIILPLLIPLMLISILIRDSNGVLATGLSLFPLTAPVVMMTRLAAGEVPVWQTILAALLLAFSAVLIVRAVANMFRAQTLLSGQSFNLRRLLTAIAGRA
jgi:ABC-2 type transport system permease protein